MALDPIDRAILAALLRDGRLSWRDLADAIGLGPTATAERARRLRTDGVLRGFTAVLDPARLGRALEATCDVQLGDDVPAADFEAALREVPAVTDAVHLTGAFDYLLRLACADPADLDATLYALKRAGARRTETRVVLRRIAGLDPAGLLDPPVRPARP
jgi:Lrp/AsnC family transcriptional regulator, leucine-responsive regulatory protein